jgi:hypothetical protein
MARKHRGVRPADVYMASYPRSGSVWLRFVVMETILSDSNFDDLRFAVPELGRQHLAPALASGGGRVIKSHELYRSEYKRAIHLVRDPRDVAISYFRFMQRIGKIVIRPGDDIDASFDRFIDAMLVPYRVDAHGTWQSHLFSWVTAEKDGRVDLIRVRYEDLKSDTAGKVRDIARFLGVELTDADARRVAERTTIDRMRAAERETMERGETPFARLGRETGIGVVNTGRVQGWRERMTPEQVARFAAFADGMALMGYPET